MTRVAARTIRVGDVLRDGATVISARHGVPHAPEPGEVGRVRSVLLTERASGLREAQHLSPFDMVAVRDA
jgi:hypothetical protein